MATDPSQIDTPGLFLRSCTIQEHCQALRRLQQCPFWWYQGTSRLFGNYSIPFQDRNGIWWYQVKPGLCWPVDFLNPLDVLSARPSCRRSYFGYQHVVGAETAGNSHLVINVVQDVSVYGPLSIDAKRRNAVRKGLKSCRVHVAQDLDSETLDGCRKAWDDLSQRTGWKQVAEPIAFERTWRTLLGCPGVSIIVGRDADTGEVAGFLITKIIGDTAYVDTIASRNDMLKTNVNDALMFAFVSNAATLPGVRKAHFAIRSNVENLERFKTGIGFTPVPYPAITRLRPLVGPALRLLKTANYNRMIGRFPAARCDPAVFQAPNPPSSATDHRHNAAANDGFVLHLRRGRELGDGDLRHIAELHALFFRGSVLGSLGADILKLLYQGMAVQDQVLVLAAVVNGETVGFVAGACHVGTVYRHFVFRHGLRIAMHVLRLQIPATVMRRLCEALRYHTFVRGRPVETVLPDAELVSMAVDVRYQGTRVATTLYQGLKEWFRQCGVEAFRIVTVSEHQRAIRFYAKMGAKPVAHRQVHRGEHSVFIVHEIQ